MTATRRSQDKNKDSNKPVEEPAAESTEATATEATAESMAEMQEDITATENQGEAEINESMCGVEISMDSCAWPSYVEDPDSTDTQDCTLVEEPGQETSENGKDEDVEMKEDKTEDNDNQDESNEKKKEETVEIKEDDETKKNRLVDQLYKAEFLKAVTETITIEPVKSQLLKNEEFIGLLSKAKVLNLQMEHQTGTAKLTFAPYREWMASRILKGLNRLQKDDSKLNIECSEELKDLLALEKAGKLKGDSREQQTSKCLYVNNIPKDTTEETLKAFFPKCVKVYVRGESEESVLGWAVMEFSSKAEMEESFESQKEIEIGEGKIEVCKVKPFEKRGKGFKGKGKFQKGGFKGMGDKANKLKPTGAGGDKPKGGAQQSSTAMKANDLKRKAQNQKIQQFSTNQKRRKLGSMGGPMGGGMGGMGSFQFGNRNKNMRGSGMGMSILGNPRGGNSMMNLGIGPSVPNMMGMGNNMGNMMGMGNMGGMGGGMGGNMGGMGMSQNMGMMGNNMGGNMSSFNNMGGNMSNQKNKRNNKRGGNMDRGGQWSGGQGNFQDSPSDELSSKLSNVLSKQRMGQDSDSDMVSMLQSALKAAQKRMSSKDSGDRESSRMLPPSSFSNSGGSGVNQGNKKQRQQRQKKQNSGSNRWGSGSGNYSSNSSSSNTSYISTTGGNYGSRDNSNWNSGSNYDSSQSYGGSSSPNYYGGGYSGTSDQSNTGAAYYDQGNYGSTHSSYSDTSSYKPSSQSYDFSQRSSSDSYYRSGYY